ncbi:uncharacterized mitochondrial protein AtMg00810-like [Manihot esculenta]|uniref:uncharacterized mitochondrial protein AtMg00810-like n=1 Tax=Manihot esculenta TaxID=3983 RepID=UPI000B5D7FA5|nr:uncharacterized mitochondrial protein AtMg00810-like [Manihot esculenta]
MKKIFEMLDLGKLHYFLGMEIKQAEDGIFIFQRKYATNLLTKFNMLNCKTAPTLMNLNDKFQNDDGTQSADGNYFRSLVGGLISLIHSRPYTVFAYAKTPEYKLYGFTDSDWARCLEDRKSTTGYVFSLGSGAVTWSSKKQATIALSTSEAEYMTATASTCKVVWLRKFFGRRWTKTRRSNNNIM